MKTHTESDDRVNTVAEMLVVLSQANPDSIVKNEIGIPVSAYLDPMSLEVIIVEDL